MSVIQLLSREGA